MAQGDCRKAGGGLARPVNPSADLAAITRQRSASAQPGRFEGVGSHSQEQPAKPAKQTGNLADDKLKKVFGGKDRVSMFEMNKHLSNHLK